MRHDLILASAGDGIISVDRDGRTGFVNPAAARMLGRPAGELVGSPAEKRPPCRWQRWRGSRSGEAELKRADESSFLAEYTTTPIVEDGAFVARSSPSATSERASASRGGPSRAWPPPRRGRPSTR